MGPGWGVGCRLPTPERPGINNPDGWARGGICPRWGWENPVAAGSRPALGRVKRKGTLPIAEQVRRRESGRAAERAARIP